MMALSILIAFLLAACGIGFLAATLVAILKILCPALIWLYKKIRG